jgi:homoserine trans-succinylase
MNKTKNMNIRISENEYETIKQFADFNGKSISALMLDAIWEQIKYWEDMKAVAEYERKKANGTLITTPWETVKKEFGLNNEI